MSAPPFLYSKGGQVSGSSNPGRRNRDPPRAFLSRREPETRGLGTPPPLSCSPPAAPGHQLLRSGGEGAPARSRAAGAEGAPSLPRAPPPPPALRTMTGPERRIGRVSLAAAAPAPREAAGGGRWGEELTARGGGRDARTRGRKRGGAGHGSKCGSKRGARRAAAGPKGSPGPGMRRAPAALRALESGRAAHLRSGSLGRREEEEGSRRGRRCAERSCGAGAEPGPQVAFGEQPRQ